MKKTRNPPHLRECIRCTHIRSGTLVVLHDLWLYRLGWCVAMVGLEGREVVLVIMDRIRVFLRRRGKQVKELQ